MNTSKSFTYSISSGDGIPSTGQLCNDTLIDIGPIVLPYDKYFVTCTGFAVTPSRIKNNGTVVLPDYIHLVVNNLVEKGYNTGLNSNRIILGTLQTSINLGNMTSGEGSSFTVKTMGSVRKLRFRLYNPNLTALAVGHIDTNCFWAATLLFTPIE